MGRLEGKVALITGGARGQGAADAQLFASEGASVVIGDVLDAEGALTAKEIGAQARYHHHDVTSPEEWARVVTSTLESFGRLDILVNNAGIFSWTPLATTSAKEFMRFVEVNQVGTFLGMQAVISAMAESGGGSIINVSSVDAMVGRPGKIAYSSTKWAVRGMTKVAAAELGPLGIRVNSIHPGTVDTPMLDEVMSETPLTKAVIAAVIPTGAITTAHDVAQLVLFLASEESRQCNGTEFVIDGGVLAAPRASAGSSSSRR
jgi:3alpha(or 20beta)-hydroxysteroid dehydrogenase